jgi:aerobic carbon-monoxide dehydrogenase medium subunit
MIPAAFAYQRAASLEEALGLLGEHGPETKVIAGGQSLLPLMKLRLAQPERLIDIGRLDELKGIRRLDDGRLGIGALTTYDELLREPEATAYTLMAEALPTIADVQVRNRGTIGGAVAHADPASDMPAVLLVLDADFVVRSHRGERTIPATAFFLGPFATALEADELLVEIRLPASSGRYGSAYRSIEQPASGYAIAGVAAILGHRFGILGSSVIDDVRVAVTGVAGHPYRATAVEAALMETDCSRDRIKAAAAKVVEGVEVNSDIHADREYRAAVAVVLAGRALDAARARSA